MNNETKLKSVPRMEQYRRSLSPEDRKKIDATTERLIRWKANGCPGAGVKGRPPLYFGLPEEAFHILMKGCTHSAPDMTVGLNQGLAFDPKTRQAWRACILNAYTPGYFWVGVEDGQKHRFMTFQSPFAEGDVMAVLAKFRPDTEFHWTATLHPPAYAPPWPIPAKYGRTIGQLHTFFGLDDIHHRMYIGATAAPAQRCGGMELSLLGTSGLDKETVRGVLFARYATGRQGWYVAKEQTLAKVAKLCSQHAKRVVLG